MTKVQDKCVLVTYTNIPVWSMLFILTYCYLVEFPPMALYFINDHHLYRKETPPST